MKAIAYSDLKEVGCTLPRCSVAQTDTLQRFTGWTGREIRLESDKQLLIVNRRPLSASEHMSNVISSPRMAYQEVRASFGAAN